MARYRLSEDAKADIAAILRVSEAAYGIGGRIRYRGLLTACLRSIAAEPDAPMTVDRSGLGAGLRSIHMRYGRDLSREPRVADPVHVVYFRAIDVRTVAIVRVLHERMDAVRHLNAHR